MLRFFSEKINKIQDRKEILDQLNDLFKEKYLKSEIDFQCKVRITFLGEASTVDNEKIFPLSIEFRASGALNYKDIDTFKKIIDDNYLKDNAFLRKLRYLNISYITCTYNDKFSSWHI